MQSPPGNGFLRGGNEHQWPDRLAQKAIELIIKRSTQHNWHDLTTRSGPASDRWHQPHFQLKAQFSKTR
jgi:hypothetical protein